VTPRDFEQFVGVPWLDGGRTEAGADCWGLFWLVYRHVLGIELPSYSADYTTALDRLHIRRLVDDRPDYWIQVADPEPGDGALMHVAGRPHIGVVVGGGRLLHIEKGAGAVIESYHSLRISNLLEGFYRYVP
jgi:cell wall-associated NlpC family hydrolase